MSRANIPGPCFRETGEEMKDREEKGWIGYGKIRPPEVRHHYCL